MSLEVIFVFRHNLVDRQDLCDVVELRAANLRDHEDTVMFYIADNAYRRNCAERCFTFEIKYCDAYLEQLER